MLPKRTIHRLCLFALLACLLMLGGAAQAQEAALFRVYLTFEDGPTDAYTPGILDTLAQYNAKASFLINGWQIEEHAELLQREVREGHAIVNHLWEEPGLYAESEPDGIRASYLATEEAIRAALGDMLPVYDAQVKMFWQPGGSTDPLPEIPGVQAITYNWNVNSDDCGYGMPNVDLDTLDFDAAVIDNVLNTSVTEGQLWNVYDHGDGVIIAFHDINRVTGRVLPTILDELTRAGATFVALPRPGDVVGTMPVVIGVPPADHPGVAGLRLETEVLADYTNLRAEPTLSSAILSVIPPNTTITAIGRNDGGWIQVEYDGMTGWVVRNLVKVFGPIPSLPH
jgi:peptidoglycan/xylan/chitin deacetylase (PgdA/CDA1 family)